MTTTLSPSTIIGRAFAIYRTQVGTLLAGAALIYLAQFVVNLVLPDSLDWIGSIVSLVLTAFFTGMVVMLVRDLQDGHRDSSLGELFSSVTPVLVPVIVVSILFGIGVAIGFVLIIIPGLILLTIWSVVIPVTVVERPGILAAFGRSRELVRGNGWQVFGTILLVWLIAIVVGALGGLLASAFGGVIGALIVAIIGALIAPVIALTAALIYFVLVEGRQPAAADTWTTSAPEPPAGTSTPPPTAV
jgi:ABC-type multidrug transport system fused ATPase/permease subunit